MIGQSLSDFKNCLSVILHQGSVPLLKTEEENAFRLNA